MKPLQILLLGSIFIAFFFKMANSIHQQPVNENQEDSSLNIENLTATVYRNNTAELHWNHHINSNEIDSVLFEIEVKGQNTTDGNQKNFTWIIFESMPNCQRREDNEMLRCTLPVTPTEYKSTYCFELPEPIPVSTVRYIDVRAKHMRTETVGRPQGLTIISYPPIPRLVHPAIMQTDVTETTTTIALNVTRENENIPVTNCLLVILMSDTNATKKDKESIKNIDKILGTKFQDRVGVRIAAVHSILHYEKSKLFQYTIGNETSSKAFIESIGLIIEHKSLNNKEMHEYTVLIVNAFHDKYTHAPYYITQGSSAGFKAYCSSYFVCSLLLLHLLLGYFTELLRLGC